MGNRLNICENFVPCPVKPGDELYELGTFVFNISSMWDFIEKNSARFFPEEIPVNSQYSAFSKINHDHVDAVDISRPVIIAEITPGQFALIDGNHRIEKARRLGMKTIKAYRLKISDHIRFLTSKESYEKFVKNLL